MNIFETTLHQRSSIEELYKQSLYFTGQWPFQYFADSLSEVVAVLNKNRQIVFCNQSLINFLGVESANDLVGKRPGEAFHCIYADLHKSGCGASEVCTMCGVYRAVTKSHKGSTNEQECRIIREPDSSALELQVRAAPLTVDGQFFTIFSATDISNEKRRKALEGVFFHDVLNTVGGLVGYTELLQESTPEEMKQFAPIIHQLSLELADQIKAQYELSEAEHNEYAVNIETVHSLSLLETIRATYLRHSSAHNKTIIINPTSEDFICATDERLLKRIIGNLVKNALEASPEIDVVTMGCKRRDNEIQFWVRNSSLIPQSVQLQIFQRSFSTKGDGRGLGTYSVKLFTERYLKGKASFVSNQDDGTIFTITLPATLSVEAETSPIVSEFEAVAA
jgi:K+-sensing histidine kinase KdpD